MEDKVIRRKRKLIALCVVLFISVGLTAFFAVSLTLEIHTMQSGQIFYNDLYVDIISRSVQKVPVVGNPVNNESTITEVIDFFEAHVPSIDFVSMRETLPDLVAWIQSNNTIINYPVVHGSDNDFYLSHLPDTSKNKMGSIFLDYRNLPDFSDKNIIIYGHNMASGDLFGSLKNYSSQSYFEQHNSMFLFTPTADYELLLFAGYILDSLYEVPPMNFNDLVDFERYISEIRNRSVFKSEVEVSFDDQIVFLCTCTPSGSKSERLIIVCKLASI